jgi:hypothetical protein
MKTTILQILSIAIVISLASCEREGIVKERPDNIVPTGERLEAFNQIMADFPEHKSVRSSKPQLFEASAGKQILIKNETDVYVTYISEGASYANTVGWYSYNVNSKPGNPSELQLNILFPHVSDRVLQQGDRVRVGDQKFAPGTVVGFFMIVRGWENQQVNFDRQTFYTDIDWNPNGDQQHVLYQQQSIGELVLGFEDELTSASSDEDYNDLIFLITDNPDQKPMTNFDLSAIVGL